MGFGMSPLVGAGDRRPRTAEAGSGAGVTTTLQIGYVLGIAVIGLLFFMIAQ